MVNRKLVLIGGGGHCKSVLDSALQSGIYSKIVITDPKIKKRTQICGCEIVGTDDVLMNLREQGYEYAFITVGSTVDVSLRKKLVELTTAFKFKYPVIIDPTATVSTHAKIGMGTFVGKYAVVNADAMIGQHCIINTGAIVEHECRVADFAHVSVGSILCGNVDVGRECFIGAGAVVNQGLKIGGNSVIGAGAVVIDNLPGCITAVGVPAKVISVR